MDIISIIVPVYNAEKYLRECIESILCQTYKTFELVLVDDGSSDNSGKICDEYATRDERIKVIHKENGGVSSVRNLGIEVSNGEYITFIDSDDFVDEKYLELMHNRILETNSDMCFCHFDRFDETSFVEYKEKIPDKMDVNFSDPDFVEFACWFFKLKNNVFGSSCRVLYKRFCIENVRFNPKIKISEDLIFVLNAILNSKSICSIPNVFYHYRINSSSASGTYKKDFLVSQLELKNELDSIFECFESKMSKSISTQYYSLLCYYLFSNELKYRKQNRDYKKNIKDIKQSTLYNYFSLRNILRLKKIKTFIVWFFIKLHIY